MFRGLPSRCLVFFLLAAIGRGRSFVGLTCNASHNILKPDGSA
jgi:hypothetical protein